MKVLIVNTYDISGGAARAAYRLHKALQSIGVESSMLVQSKISNDSAVIGPQNKVDKALSMRRQKWDELPLKCYKKKSYALFSPAWVPLSTIVKKINASDADIIHLHWINHGMMRIEDIARIKKPIVWSLHDMWAFTGGCHYDCGCGKYTSHCMACPILGSEKRNDLSYRVFERKVKTYTKLPSLTIVGLSRWLSACSKSCILFNGKKIVNLPNPIDTNIFRPLERETARDLLDLPLEKKLVIFGADNAMGDPRKGFKELSAAMHLIKSKGVELLVFGSSNQINSLDLGFATHYLGHIPNDLSLRLLYCAADVLVVSSIQENLSNAIMESLASGTPVVAFDLGGNSDMIDHKHNGYLATPYDPLSLAEGIDWILDHPAPQTLSQNARRKVMETFEATKVANQYVELYEEILKKFE